MTFLSEIMGTKLRFTEVPNFGKIYKQIKFEEEKIRYWTSLSLFQVISVYIMKFILFRKKTVEKVTQI